MLHGRAAVQVTTVECTVYRQILVTNVAYFCVEKPFRHVHWSPLLKKRNSGM